MSSVEEITFDDVTFSYIDDRQVLDGLSFDVARGEFVAFVGRSVREKSIVSLLARFYGPGAGMIALGDSVDSIIHRLPRKPKQPLDSFS